MTYLPRKLSILKEHQTWPENTHLDVQNSYYHNNQGSVWKEDCGFCLRRTLLVDALRYNSVYCLSNHSFCCKLLVKVIMIILEWDKCKVGFVGLYYFDNDEILPGDNRTGACRVVLLSSYIMCEIPVGFMVRLVLFLVIIRENWTLILEHKQGKKKVLFRKTLNIVPWFFTSSHRAGHVILSNLIHIYIYITNQ